MDTQRLPISLKTLFIAAELARELSKDRAMTKEEALKAVRYLTPTQPESGESLQNETAPLPYGEVITITGKEATRAQVRLHRVLGSRFFATDKGPRAGLAVSNEKVDLFLHHVDDLLRAYNAIVEDQLGLVESTTVSTFSSIFEYLFATVFSKLTRRMGMGSGSPDATPEESFRPASVQEIQINDLETRWEAIRRVREGKSAFALLTLDEAFRVYGKRDDEAKPKRYTRDGVVAEPLPFVEPELGIIFRAADRAKLFASAERKGDPELATLLSRNVLLLLPPGVDPLSDILRRLHLSSVRELVRRGEVPQGVIIQCESFRHVKTLVQEGLGIGVGERPVGDAEDRKGPSLAFKSFGEVRVDDALKRELAAAVTPIRYALYYRDTWNESAKDGGVLPVAKVMMECIREACRNQLEDVYQPVARPTSRKGERNGSLFQEYACRLVFQTGADGKPELVARLCL